MEDLNDKKNFSVNSVIIKNLNLDYEVKLIYPDYGTLNLTRTKRELREDSLTGRKTIQLIFPELHP